MSPRRTQTLHEVGHSQHLRPVGFVCFESGDFGRHGSLVMKAGGGLHQRPADCLGAADSDRLEHTQSA